MSILSLKNKSSRRYLGIEQTDSDVLSPYGWSLELSSVDGVEFLSGKRQGEMLDGLIIPANSKVKLMMGTIKPSKYNVLLQPNPELLLKASLGAPFILEPGEEQELVLVLNTFREVDLEEYTYFLRLYLVD
jgi:hypothetical protein